MFPASLAEMQPWTHPRLSAGSEKGQLQPRLPWHPRWSRLRVATKSYNSPTRFSCPRWNLGVVFLFSVASDTAASDLLKVEQTQYWVWWPTPVIPGQVGEIEKWVKDYLLLCSKTVSQKLKERKEIRKKEKKGEDMRRNMIMSVTQFPLPFHITGFE